MLFKLPEPNACGGVKGVSREEPIVLPDISQTDFQNFLKALYPLYVPISSFPKAQPNRKKT
jgi:hypothetical protein